MLDLSVRTIQIVLAWAGFRWDIGTMSVGVKLIWAVIILGITIGGFVMPYYPIPRWLLGSIIAFGWFIYYFGLSFLLLRINRILIAHFGEQAGWHIHAMLLGVIFAIQSVAFQCACNLHVWPIIEHPFSLFSPEPAFTKSAVVLYVAGLALAVIGFGGKFAATWSGGLEMYYCKDMFYGRDIGTGFVASGIFSLIHSPMYGVGNVQLYGLGLMANDWLAVLLGLVFHISINVFDRCVEQPFVRKTYGGGNGSDGTSSTALFDDN